MTKNARAVLKQFVEAIEQDDISPTMSTGFEKAYQNAMAVLQEPVDTSPAKLLRAVVRSVQWHDEFLSECLRKDLENPPTKFTGLVGIPLPAPAAAELQYKSMFEAAISALAAIDDALGIDADGCNEPEITLDEIRRLKAAAGADKRDAERWIPVSERLPDADTGILVTDGVIVTAARMTSFHNGRLYWDGHYFGGYEWDFDFNYDDITHWMPLPPPPAIAAQKEAGR